MQCTNGEHVQIEKVVCVHICYVRIFFILECCVIVKPSDVKSQLVSSVCGYWSLFYISDMFACCIFTGDKNEDTEFLYYISEGVYGPFSCKLLGNSVAAPSVHKVSRPAPTRGDPVQNRLKHLITALVELGQGVRRYQCDTIQVVIHPWTLKGA